MIRMGVSGRMFLLVSAYPGSPGTKAVKRLCVCVASVPCIHIRIEWVLINFIVPSCQLLPPSKVNISVSNSHLTDVAIYKLYVLWSIY